MPAILQASIFKLPGFDAAVHTGYDLMHAVAGVMKDTFVGLLQSKRYTPVVEAHEAQVNRRFSRQRPWELDAESLHYATEALKLICAATNSRMTGSRFLRLFSIGEKKKSHMMHVLASPYGK